LTRRFGLISRRHQAARICIRNQYVERRIGVQRFDICSNFFHITPKIRLRVLIKRHTKFATSEICVWRVRSSYPQKFPDIPSQQGILRFFCLSHFGGEAASATSREAVRGCLCRVKSFEVGVLHRHPLTLPSPPKWALHKYPKNRLPFCAADRVFVQDVVVLEYHMSAIRHLPARVAMNSLREAGGTSCILRKRHRYSMTGPMVRA